MGFVVLAVSTEVLTVAGTPTTVCILAVALATNALFTSSCTDKKKKKHASTHQLSKST